MDPSGDADFEEFFRERWPSAFAVARRVLGDVADAEDAAAEGFARALLSWRRVGRLEYREAWLLRVVSNVAIDRARKRGRIAAAEVAVVADPQDVAVLRVTLVEALAALPRRQREVIVLRHLAGYPEADVARSLGISVNSVKKHTSRGIGRLRDRLGRPVEEVDVAFGN